MKTDVKALIGTLKAERSKIDRVIAALEMLDGDAPPPVASGNGATRGKRKQWTAAARAAKSAAMKAWHAQRKAAGEVQHAVN